jgi:hypothetical protein
MDSGVKHRGIKQKMSDEKKKKEDTFYLLLEHLLPEGLPLE